MREHLSDDEIDAYLDEALGAAAGGALEAHVAGCEACAARLGRAAEAELTLHALGHALGAGPRALGKDRASDHASDHASDDELDGYLDDALGKAARVAFEAHVRTCEACASRLARAAEAELALHAVGAEPPERAARLARRTASPPDRLAARLARRTASPPDRLAAARAQRRPRVVVAAAAGALAAAFAVAIAVRDRSHDGSRDAATGSRDRTTAPTYRGGLPPVHAPAPAEPSEVALATPEERLDLPSSAELVTFVPEAE